ncbi:hypothetical protein DERF_014636 [Dermatophagoides farinae]|uniref:Uncharacterized protein n=1 Tax=Dermatophagoides farinae TaxID=6954 RepID=A0A922HPJ4_DERFA|nr:hypothetical protein DERF_014636 [Dermatophagoides farinae]
MAVFSGSNSRNSGLFDNECFSSPNDDNNPAPYARIWPFSRQRPNSTWPIFPDLHRLHQVKLILFLVKNRQNFHQPILVYGPIIHEHNLVQTGKKITCSQ